MTPDQNEGGAHTRGPWRVMRPIGVANPTYLHIVGPTVASGVIAKVNAKRPDNARLIAACPTMFDYILGRARDGDAQAIAIVEAVHASR